jgi:hypothetical protein
VVGAKGDFELYSSRLVVQECQAGDPRAAADRLAALAGVPLLEQTPDAAALAELLMRGVPLPERAAADALHIAITAVHGVDYLLTWNCAHIANVTLRPQIEAVCRAAGYEPPLICTPEELPTGGGTMSEDSVLQEVRAAREAYAQSHGFDVRAMVADLRERDDCGDWPVVRLAPRRPADPGGSQSGPNPAVQRPRPDAAPAGQS